MISYYDLLGMIKEGNIPDIVAIHQNSGVINYVAQYDGSEFSYYEIENADDLDMDSHFYLSDCLLDSEMHKECIEIIKNRKIKELDIHQEKNIKDNWKWKCEGYNISKPQKIIADKVNEIIRKINKNGL